jgi:hypothetical protein
MKRFILIATIVIAFCFASLRPTRADSCPGCFEQGTMAYQACVAGGGSSKACGDMAEAIRCACYATSGCTDGLLSPACFAGGN